MKEVALFRRSLIFIFLICVSFVSSSVEQVDLELTKSVYGQGQNFEGTFSIDTASGDLFSVHEEVRTKFDSCEDVGSNTEYYSLYDLLVSADLFFGQEYNYELGEYYEHINYNQNSSTDIYSFSTESAVTSINFDLSGTGKSLLLDIGSDGDYDWSFLGERIDWSQFFYAPDFESIDYSPDIATVDYSVEFGGACNTINIEFDELVTDLDLQIYSTVKRVGDGANLTAVVDGGESCVLNVTSENYQEVFCNVKLDVSSLGDSIDIPLCLMTTDWAGTNFETPRYAGEEYYFIKAKAGVYNESLPEGTMNIGGDFLKDELNDYRFENNCGSGQCLIPFKIYLEEGSVLLENLELKYGGITDSNFWEMSQVPNQVNLDDVLLPLSSIEDLITPSEELDECFLELRFDGEEDMELFSVGSSPIASINLNSIYYVEGDIIQFESYLDSSAGVQISSYFWDFGDGVNSTLASPTHQYNLNGEFTVTLTITDSQGVSDIDSVVIHIQDLEEYLDSKFVEINEGLDSSFSFFSNLNQDLLDIYILLNFDNSLIYAETSVNDLEQQFLDAKVNTDLTTEEKNIFYGEIATSLESLLSITPSTVGILDSLSVQGMLIDSPFNILSYAGTSSLSSEEFNSYREELYLFNQNNVNVNTGFILFELNYFEGNQTYMLVRKNVEVVGGENNVIVENLKDQDMSEVYGDGVIDSSSKVIYWAMENSKDIVYIVKRNNLDLIHTTVFSDIDYEIQEMIYDYQCVTDSCDHKYCGDGYCTTFEELGVFESELDNLYYCEVDCKKLPNYVWAILIIFLILGIFYINFYRGPGNFQALANKITFTLFRRKLFVTDKDRIVLTDYIESALNRGFNREQINLALIKKGWNEKQLDAIFRNI